MIKINLQHMQIIDDLSFRTPKNRVDFDCLRCSLIPIGNNVNPCLVRIALMLHAVVLQKLLNR